MDNILKIYADGGCWEYEVLDKIEKDGYTLYTVVMIRQVY